MQASTGGYKKVLNTENNTIDDQFFCGQSSQRTVRVVIDLLPPTHCVTAGNCSSEDVRPVDVGLEIGGGVSRDSIATDTLYLS